MPPRTPPRGQLRILNREEPLFLALLWVLLAGWDADYLAYGVVSVAAATALSHLLVPRSRLRLHVVGTARLVAWFLQIGRAHV